MKTSNDVQKMDVKIPTPDKRHKRQAKRLVSRETKSTAKGFGFRFSRMTKEIVTETCKADEANDERG